MAVSYGTCKQLFVQPWPGISGTSVKSSVDLERVRYLSVN